MTGEDITSDVNIWGGAGIHQVKICDASSNTSRGTSPSNPGTLSEYAITGMAAGGNFIFSGDFGAGITLSLGSGNDIQYSTYLLIAFDSVPHSLTVNSLVWTAKPSSCALTAIYTGAGNDNIIVNLALSLASQFVLFTQV